MQRKDAKPLTIGELQQKYKMPEQVHTFELETTKGLISKCDFNGSFTVKTLTLDEEAVYLAEVDSWVFTSTNGNPAGISKGVYEYIDMKTFLKYAITDAPEWWWDFSLNPVDINVLIAVYNGATKFKEKLEQALLQNDKAAIGKKDGKK